MAKEKKDDDQTETEPAAQTAGPDPWTVMDKLADALQGLKASQAAQTPRGEELMIKLSTALERVSAAQLEGSKLIADETRRSHRPSNEITPGISVFNRRGLNLSEAQMAEGCAKPLLKCIMLVPWLVEWESATREEVELLNLLQDGTYVLKRIDNSKLTVTVRTDLKEDMVTPSRLVMNHDTGFNNDNFRLMPPLTEMLRQILRQHPTEIAARARMIVSDEEEEMMIEAGKLSVSLAGGLNG